MNSIQSFYVRSVSQHACCGGTAVCNVVVSHFVSLPAALLAAHQIIMDNENVNNNGWCVTHLMIIDVNNEVWLDVQRNDDGTWRKV